MADSTRNFSWLKIALLCLSGGVIFILPYLRYGYYDAMAAGLGINNLQMGAIMAAYGFFCIPGYFIGGILSDYWGAKKLLVVSFLGSGLAGLYLATLPGYMPVLIIHGFFGITTVLTFWAAFQKATRLSATSENQGKIFGIVSGGRKVVSMVVAALGLWVFSLYPKAEEVAGFQTTVTMISILYIVISILFIFVWKDDENVEQVTESKKAKNGITLAEFIQVAKMPETWLLTCIFFGVYSSYRLGDFFTPYMTKELGIAAALAGVVGYAKSYAITPVGSFVSGYFADKVGRIRWSMIVVFLAMCFKLLLVVVPASAPVLVVGTILCFMLFIWAAYTLFYALLDDANIPDKFSGTVIGIASCVGLSGETTSPIIGGWILDNYPGISGYHMLFGVSAAFCAFSIVFYFIFSKYIERKKAAHLVEPQEMGLSGYGA